MGGEERLQREGHPLVGGCVSLNMISRHPNTQVPSWSDFIIQFGLRHCRRRLQVCRLFAAISVEQRRPLIEALVNYHRRPQPVPPRTSLMISSSNNGPDRCIDDCAHNADAEMNAQF